MIFPLRNNEEDFLLWCQRYVHQAVANMESFRKGGLDIHRERELYDSSLCIKRQLYAIETLLSPQHLDYFHKVLLTGGSPTNEPIEKQLYREIYNIWSSVCFPQGKTNIKTIDPVLLGGELRRLRLEHGFSAKHTSELINVAEKTLFFYEEGRGLPKLDVFYKLCYLYGVSMMEVARASETRAPVPESKGNV